MAEAACPKCGQKIMAGGAATAVRITACPCGFRAEPPPPRLSLVDAPEDDE